MNARVEPPVPATSVMVDLRNFTPNLNAAAHDPDGTNQFCYFLAEFYAAALDACLLALAPEQRQAPTFAVNSTGDGLLAVFLGPRHFADGLLVAFLLEASLRRCCQRREQIPARPFPVSFGVGVESGEVARVHARSGGASVDTFIGHCVNVAARIEALTKLLSSASVAIGDTTIELCTDALYGETFSKLREQEQRAATDAERVAVQKRMDEINRDLCLTFLDRYILKGVELPLPLYRIDGTATRPGVERFEKLLRALVRGDERHLAEVRAHLELS
jgi:class 3 adenylate cyclase